MGLFSKVWEYYSRKDVQKALIEAAKNREVVGVFSNGNFGNRPNTLLYPADIMEMVKQGVVSFHGSVERWSNPMALEAGLIKEEMDKLRIGWDLIIDPDCPDFEISKLATKLIVKALEDHGIKSYSIKLTGGKSFHIGLPFESFPEKVNFQETRLLYPDLPRKIIEYLKYYVKEELKEELLGLDNPVAIAKRVGKSIEEVVDKDGLDPFKVVQIDSLVISPRHLFRLPYSLHEKSLLVSLPIKKSQLDKIEKDAARPENVKVELEFLKRDLKFKEAGSLLIEALDWAEKFKIEPEKIKYVRKRRRIREIPKSLFPPCILKILNGLSDGRKRSVFILINFLRNMGWEWEKIEKEINEWNERNKPPLPSRYIRTQLRWHARQERNLLPPNCDNKNFYVDFGVCLPDNICKSNGLITIKNPINYPFRKMKKE